MRLFLGLFLGFGLVASASAEVPPQLHYNGYLTNAVGDPVDCPDVLQCNDNYDITFRLYATEDATASIWEETHASLPLYGGSFHALLGSGTAITSDLLDGPVWLAVKVNNNAEMLPRQQVASAAYAIKAGTVDYAENAAQLGGLNPEDFASTESVTELQTIIAGTDDDTLAALGCAPGQVAKASVAGWICADAAESDTTLSEAQVDEMVANNGYAALSESIGGLACGVGQVVKWNGSNWLCDDDTDTSIPDTNTQLSEAEVDGMVANNGYATQEDITASLASLSGAQIIKSTNESLNPGETLTLPTDAWGEADIVQAWVRTSDTSPWKEVRALNFGDNPGCTACGPPELVAFDPGIDPFITLEGLQVFSEVTIPGWLTINATGTQPLIIRSTSSINIAGSILADGPPGNNWDAGGNGGQADNGGGFFGGSANGGAGAGPGGGSGGGGVSGCGAAAASGTGGQNSTYPGQEWWLQKTPPLQSIGGGSGGGAGGTGGSHPGGGGGAGGGVIVLVAQTITIDGTVSAKGGNGGGGKFGGSCSSGLSGAGGGGSGGSIYLRATTITINGTAVVDGGSGENSGQPGIVRLDSFITALSDPNMKYVGGHTSGLARPLELYQTETGNWVLKNNSNDTLQAKITAVR